MKGREKSYIFIWIVCWVLFIQENVCKCLVNKKQTMWCFCSMTFSTIHPCHVWSLPWLSNCSILLLLPPLKLSSNGCFHCSFQVWHLHNLSRNWPCFYILVCLSFLLFSLYSKASLIITDRCNQIAPGFNLDFVYPLGVAFQYYPLKPAVENEFDWSLLNLTITACPPQPPAARRSSSALKLK